MPRAHMSRSVRSTAGMGVMRGSLAPNEMCGNRGSFRMRVIVVRHHAEDSAGFIGEAFEARGADKAGVPVLGICYGAQELCTIFGGRVVAASQKEVGWKLIETVRPDLIPAGPWLEFHGDKCEPPLEAAVLASNDVGIQAFSIGKHLGVQFHPEVDGAMLREWLDAGGRPEALRAGVDPDAFLAQTIAEEPGARARADRLVETALQLARASSAAGVLAG